MTPAPSPRERAERVLGKAVHPRALDRLFELWPEAEAQVRHGTFEHQSRRKHWTEVTLHKPQPVRADVVSRRAYVHSDDQRDRRKGIDIAFRRALREVSRRCKVEVT